MSTIRAASIVYVSLLLNALAAPVPEKKSVEPREAYYVNPSGVAVSKERAVEESQYTYPEIVQAKEESSVPGTGTDAPKLTVRAPIIYDKSPGNNDGAAGDFKPLPEDSKGVFSLGGCSVM